MTNEELTPELVDQVFADITQHIDEDVDVQHVAAEPEPEPEPEVRMLPRAWRWARPLDIAIFFVATVIAAGMVRANYAEALSANVKPARSAELMSLFFTPALIGLVTGIVLVVLVVTEMSYWFVVRGGLWHAVPFTHPRAGDIAWAAASATHRQLVADHQYAVHLDGNYETAFANYARTLAEAEASAREAGRNRRAACLARERAVLEGASMHQMTLEEAGKYAPHRQPRSTEGGMQPGTGVALAVGTAGVIAVGVIGGAVAGLGGYYKFMNWALHGPRR